MHQDVYVYLRNCHTCHGIKSLCRLPHTIHGPPPVPDKPWEHFLVDSLTGLPLSHSFDAICIIVDRLIRMSYFVLSHTVVTAEDLATIFLV
jgi:hypothetical protein